MKRILSGAGAYAVPVSQASRADNSQFTKWHYQKIGWTSGVGKVFYMGQKANAIGVDDIMPGWTQGHSPSVFPGM